MGTKKLLLRRAAKEAIKDAKLDNAVSAVASLFAQGAISFALWRVAGHLDLAARVATAVVPFLVLPITFLVRLTTVPVAIAKEALALSESHRLDLEQKLASALANKAVPVRDPDTIYQRGRPVGRVVAPKVELSKSSVSFEAITETADMDRSQPIEYREYTLSVFSVESVKGFQVIISDDGSKAEKDVLEGVTCRIIGTIL